MSSITKAFINNMIFAPFQKSIAKRRLIESGLEVKPTDEITEIEFLEVSSQTTLICRDVNKNIIFSELINERVISDKIEVLIKQSKNSDLEKYNLQSAISKKIIINKTDCKLSFFYELENIVINDEINY